MSSTAASHLDASSSHGRPQEAGHEEQSDDVLWDNWIDEEQPNADGVDMPSDLRSPEHRPDSRSQQNKPLLARDKQDTYSERSQSTDRLQRSGFYERDWEELARAATRKRYTYAAGFLLISLVSFAIQTETAVYIQKNLGWRKAYCMLYFTHGSWTLLWPTQLLILRLQKWQQPWPAFWRRHVALLRQTAQMIEHRTLRVPPHLAKKSPIPYFLRTTAFVTCALTIAGGSWYVAVDLTTASDLTAIYNCSAFFAYAFAVPMLGERLQWSKVFAVAVAIIGVLVVAYGDGKSNVKHGGKSGGGAGATDPAEDHNNTAVADRVLGNLVIGVGSVLYGFYEVLYKRVACPPEGCSPGRGMIFANTFGTCIGSFTLLVLWIPLPILHLLGWEKFELPQGEAAWMMVISVLANVVFSGSFLVLISLTSPVLSSVAALLTIFLVALCDELLPPPLHNDLSTAAVLGGVLIILAFGLLSWATFKEMAEEREKESDNIIESESDAGER
ncbi:hypothetical protein AMS68_001536 [Peltaster fructicola]|uniref:EamA domain-containing protein n=1 Tax=Peltaster fructicola TaxID=286661 RepID=A0A6H0XN18_9PEZI|nr:hypothetical protein AMS68_001536 [Peltaster fructicola]